MSHPGHWQQWICRTVDIASDVSDDIVITAEQLAGAPEAVRQWLRGIRAAAPERADFVLERDGVLTSGDGLAICTGSEIKQLLRQLGGNYIACQVLFQLGCEYYNAATGEHRPRMLNLTDFLHHTDVGNSSELYGCLDAINDALRQLRRDQDATIYQMVEHGGIRVHLTTQRRIYRLWRRLVRLASAHQDSPAVVTEESPAAAPRQTITTSSIR